jgi:hypothetical protein
METLSIPVTIRQLIEEIIEINLPCMQSRNRKGNFQNNIKQKTLNPIHLRPTSALHTGAYNN